MMRVSFAVRRSPVLETIAAQTVKFKVLQISMMMTSLMD
jgi:hypothetical protein